MRPEQVRTYERASSVVFLKTDEPFGGLSNMAGGYPLRVNGIRIFTSEALYQACRFPHRPEVQRLIIEQRSPITAKMKSKPYRQDSRPDWDRVRVNVMRWSLRVKLAQNWRTFSALLLKSGDRPIVEQSRKDDFWGGKAQEDGTLVGMNVLGRLLMELRELVKSKEHDALLRVAPMDIPDFLLAGQLIEFIGIQVPGFDSPPLSVAKMVYGNPSERFAMQSSMFDESHVKEAPAPAYSTVNAVSVNAVSVSVADLKPYPDYKDSGLPWVGQIPAHWDVRRLKLLLREIDSRSTTGKEQLLRVSQYTGVTQRKAIDGSDAPDTRAASLVGYKRVAPDDLVINIMLAWNGSLGVSRFEGITSPAYCVYRFVPGAKPSYYHELLRTPVYKGRIKTASRGVVESRLRLYSDDLGRIEAIRPPEDEQVAIVRFVDWANSRLERTIRAKRKVIALLNERKQAIINRAVTRGLDPVVTLKPSGIAWLGEISDGFQRTKLKRICISIRDGTHNPPPATPGNYRLLSVRNIINGQFVVRNDDRSMTSSAFDELQRSYTVQTGDVVVAIVGATTGKSAVVGKMHNVTVQRSLAILRPNPKLVTSEYLNLLVSSEVVQGQLKQIITKYAAQPGIYLNELGGLQIVYPPLRRQEEIVAFICEQSKPLTLAIDRLHREIELLREYRTRLIADVVTGKLDVRAVAATLPNAPAQGDDNEAGFDDDTLDDALDDALDTDDMDAAA